MRPCHLPPASDPAVSAGTDPPTGTLIQRCGETGTRGMDIRVRSVPLVLAPPTDMLPRLRVPLGSALAWSACLLSMNFRLMTAMVMPTPK